MWDIAEQAKDCMKSYFGFLVLVASAFLPTNALAQPTTVASVWAAHAKVCPESAREYGTFGSTKNFEVTLCHSKGKNSFYIGREKATGRSVIVPSTDGRYVNGAYEYRLTHAQSERCFLQVLHKNRIVLCEPLIEQMFMSDPCRF